MHEGLGEADGPPDADAHRGSPPEQGQVALGFFQDPVARGQDPDEEHGGQGERSHPGEQPEQPLGDAGQQRCEIVRLGEAGALQLCRQAAVVTGGQQQRTGRRDQHDGSAEHQEDQDPHAQCAVGTTEEQWHHEQADQPVGAQDVALPQQRRMHETEDQHPRVPPAQDAAHFTGRGASCCLPGVHLPDAVGEQRAEHGVGAAVDHDDGESLREMIGEIPVSRMHRAHAHGARIEEPGRVGEGDEQQHHPAREVGGEGAPGERGG